MGFEMREGEGRSMNDIESLKVGMIEVDLIDGYLGVPFPTGKGLQWQRNACAFPGNETMTDDKEWKQ